MILTEPAIDMKGICARSTKGITARVDPEVEPPTITSSTNESDRHAAAKAMDGFQNTSWRWHQNDKQPWVEVALKTPKTARVIVLTNAASRRRDLGKQAYALRVSISINGGAVTSHPLEKDELRPTRIELPTPRRVKTLKIVVLEQKRRPATDEPAPKRKPAPKGKPVPKGKPLPVGGFAEISLEK